MTKFSFRVGYPGTAEQTLIFVKNDDPAQEFPIPGLVVPDDEQARFQLLYSKLVEFGAIEDRKPIYTVGEQPPV